MDEPSAQGRGTPVAGTGRATSRLHTRPRIGNSSRSKAMAQDSIDRGIASEDTREAREHMRNVEENTRALAEQARRVEATAPESTDRPVEPLRVDGMGGEDTHMAAENQRNVHENTQA